MNAEDMYLKDLVNKIKKEEGISDPDTPYKRKINWWQVVSLIILSIICLAMILLYVYISNNAMGSCYVCNEFTNLTCAPRELAQRFSEVPVFPTP